MNGEHSKAEASRTTDPNPYVERWEQALRVLEQMTPHERERHFAMYTWGKVTQCGTVACLAGHCSLDQWFRERGFIGEIEKALDSQLAFEGLSPSKFFGDRGNEYIFHGVHESHGDVVEAVRDHIDYLKAGGNPDSLDGEDGYDD